MKKPQVSIITLLWNHGNDVTIPFLSSILRDTDGIDFELILVDNGSTDGTWDYLEMLNDSRLKRIHSDVNLGFNGGNDLGLTIATGEKILFLNNDVVISDPHWLRQLYDECGEKEVVGAQLEKGNSYTEFRHKMTPYVCGWCVMVDKEFVDENGAFNSEFGLGYFEDVEFSARAVRLGYKLKQVNIGLRHLGSKSSTDQMDLNEQTTINQRVFRSLMYKKEGRRIVFHASGMYPFTDSDYFGKGVGGAEASLILIAREFAVQGWKVDIFNDTLVEKKENGVWYRNLNNFSVDDYCDVFILFRNSMEGLDAVNSPVKVFWSCDQHTTNDWQYEVIPYIDKVIAISEYHKNYLRTHYPIPPINIEVIDLGVNTPDYEKQLGKERGKLIFCSVPNRGLKYLYDIYQKIKRSASYVSLYITSDYTLWGSDDPLNQEFREQFKSLPDVHFLGKIDREELVKHQLTSDLMVYTGDYDENFCISAMECIAAGAVPIVTAIGAMPTTVAESGVVINKTPGTVPYTDEYLAAVLDLLNNPKKLEEIRREGQERALSRYNWSVIVKEKWIPLLEDLRRSSNYMNNYCTQCDIQFKNSFEWFKHRAKEHPVYSKNPYKSGNTDERIRVLIKTTKPIELSINGLVEVKMKKEFEVPQEAVSDIIRILTGAYGSDIIDEASILKPI